MNRAFYLFSDNSVKPLRIYDSTRVLELLPPGFDAITVSLNGTLSSDLDWKQAITNAEKAINQGLKIFWQIDLGLFSKLQDPLSEQMQFLALQLSLEHFNNTLWKQFQEHTVGVSIYKGSIDFTKQMRWNHLQMENLQKWLEELFKTSEQLSFELEQAISFQHIDPITLEKSPFGKMLLQLFCRNVFFEYTDLLARRLSPDIPIYMLFDTRSCDLYLLANMLSKEGLDSLNFGIIQDEFPLNTFTNTLFGVLESHSLPLYPIQKAATAICLPSQQHVNRKNFLSFQEIVKDLSIKQTSFRVIPEYALTTSWEGIDTLIVFPSTVSPQGMRKLQGFRAAGGIILNQE